jgi:hypothetical protein
MCRTSKSRNASQIKDMHGRDNLGMPPPAGREPRFLVLMVKNDAIRAREKAI